MRAYSCVQIGAAIAVLVAACAAGIMLQPIDAAAIDRNVTWESWNPGSGGTSGGGEWKTPPSVPDGEMPTAPAEGPGSEGRGERYKSQPPADALWAKEVEGVITRMVRFVGATFSQLF